MPRARSPNSTPRWRGNGRARNSIWSRPTTCVAWPAARIPDLFVPFPGATVTIPDAQLGGLDDSLQTLVTHRFSDVYVGVSVGLPIGQRAAKADVVAATLAERRTHLLRDQIAQRIATEVRTAAATLWPPRVTPRRDRRARDGRDRSARRRTGALRDGPELELLRADATDRAGPGGPGPDGRPHRRRARDHRSAARHRTPARTPRHRRRCAAPGCRSRREARSPVPDGRLPALMPKGPRDDAPDARHRRRACRGVPVARRLPTRPGRRPHSSQRTHRGRRWSTSPPASRGAWSRCWCAKAIASRPATCSCGSTWPRSRWPPNATRSR